MGDNCEMSGKSVVLIVIIFLIIFAAAGVIYSRNKIMETPLNDRKANSLLSTGVKVGDVTYYFENFENIEQARLVAVRQGQPSQEIWSRGFSSYTKDPRDFLVYAQLNSQYDADNIYVGIRHFDPVVQSNDEYKEVYYQVDRETGTLVKELDFPPVYQEQV